MKSLKGLIFALISSSTFGLIPLFSIPLILNGSLGMPSILFYRFALATLTIGLIGVCCRRDFRIKKKELFWLLGLGWLYAGTSMGLLFSYRLIPSGVGTTIHFLYPIVVAFIMVLFFKERRSYTLFGAALLSLAGVALMSWSGGTINFSGIGIVLITVVTYASYIVGVNRSGVERIDILPLTFYVLLSGTLMFALYASLTTGFEPITDSSVWTNLLLLAIVPTVVSDLTLVLAIKYTGSTVTAILGSMEPLVAVVVGVFCFSEPFSINSAFGLILIIMSVSLVVWQSREKARPVIA